MINFFYMASSLALTLTPSSGTGLSVDDIAELLLSAPRYEVMRYDDSKDRDALFKILVRISKAQTDDIESGMILALERNLAISRNPSSLFRDFRLLNRVVFNVPADKLQEFEVQNGRVVGLRPPIIFSSGPPLTPISEFRTFKSTYKRRHMPR
jgi:hypothetical protein